MRAIQISEFGGPEVLQLVELPKPEPGPSEVLIKVTRAGLNFADTHTRTNSYVKKASLPLVPGSEVAGVREDTGERVVALVGDGGYAEYATAPRELVHPLPDALDDGTALAIVIQGLTAWHLYRTAAKLAPGESVVVHSAAGGVGSLAVQLGRLLGAGRVIATASSEQKRADPSARNPEIDVADVDLPWAEDLCSWGRRRALSTARSSRGQAADGETGR